MEMVVCSLYGAGDKIARTQGSTDCIEGTQSFRHCITGLPSHDGEHAKSAEMVNDIIGDPSATMLLLASCIPIHKWQDRYRRGRWRVGHSLDHELRECDQIYG